MRDELLYEVFLDLIKARNTLDWEQCLEFMVAHGFRTGMERPLCKYWEGLITVARVRRYYGTPFTGCRGVIQGEPLSPTILNMVVDAVICH